MRDSTRQLITTAILLAAMLAWAAPTAGQATAYAPTYLDPIDLGTLGGTETRAYAANGGRIVGASQTVDGTIHAFKYENGVLTDMGTLGGSTSWAFAINAAGAVAGSASVPGEAEIRQPEVEHRHLRILREHLGAVVPPSLRMKLSWCGAKPAPSGRLVRCSQSQPPV